MLQLADAVMGNSSSQRVITGKRGDAPRTRAKSRSQVARPTERTSTTRLFPDFMPEYKQTRRQYGRASLERFHGEGNNEAVNYVFNFTV